MKILLVGCGKMGSAIMNGWLKSGILASAIAIIDPVYNGKIKSYASLAELPKNYSPDFVLLAVKPQNLSDILPGAVQFKKAIFISIIAGKTISYFQKFLPQSLIIRTMPNLPALIGKGITAAISSAKLDSANKTSINKLLKPCGKLVWVKDEELIDSVTAISGSGPAYIFLFLESMIKSATDLGLDEKTAQTLVFETIKGSLSLAEQSEESLSQLKINVTSKGGTTEAALKILENGDGLEKLLKKATSAAKKRAKELSE